MRNLFVVQSAGKHWAVKRLFADSRTPPNKQSRQMDGFPLSIVAFKVIWDYIISL